MFRKSTFLDQNIEPNRHNKQERGDQRETETETHRETETERQREAYIASCGRRSVSAFRLQVV